MALIASICAQAASGSFVARIIAARPAFLPPSGVDACADTPTMVISSTPVCVHSTPQSLLTSFIGASARFISRPSKRRVAFCGTAFSARPASSETRRGSAVDSSTVFEIVPRNWPFSMLMSGNSASGEKVISASGSVA